MSDRTFLIAISVSDADLADFLDENVQKGRAIEKIGVFRDAPTATAMLAAPKRALTAKSREDAILGALKSGARTGPELRAAYRAAGFAASGYYAVNTRLQTQGKITKRGKRGTKVKTYERRA